MLSLLPAVHPEGAPGLALDMTLNMGWGSLSVSAEIQLYDHVTLVVALGNKYIFLINADNEKILT